jgi:predicted ATPase/class 3 adenylate cyclase
MPMTLESQTIQPPQGVVTLLFTDVEGSTAAWEKYADTFGEALQIHDRKLRAAIVENDGYVVKTVGDAFMAAFATAPDAVSAALRIQRELAEGDESPAWHAVGGVRVRIGIHTGEPAFRGNDYFGPPVNRAARISDAGHGGMILVSHATLQVAKPSFDNSVTLIDHGHHKLKDLGDPEHLFEIRLQDVPAPSKDRLRTLEMRQHNFPAQVTSLVGRQRELAELHSLISKGTNRLITLTGPGGTGKTRLALQVAVDRVQDFPDGIWLVDLAGTYDPAVVPAAIATALQLELTPGTDARSIVANHLRARRTMLVLDNFEQVADSAAYVSELLRECRDLVCFVTSRELLRVSGETEYEVEPLAIPPAGVSDAPWASYESVQLFLERCHAAGAGLELTDENGPVIGEICRRLDGIPLAIELAAARVRGMTPSQILQRMSRMFDLLAFGRRDLPDRQRTLRSAIDWSYDLLNEDEKELFAELAIFAGGFTLEAAEEVCLVPGAFEYLFSLRDKSLLKTVETGGEARFYMLATLREYASERLHKAESLNEICQRHSEYYLRLAKDWSSQLANAGKDAPEAMRVFTTDLDNVRAGMDWAVQSDLADETVEFAKALFAILRRRGLYSECDVRLMLGAEAARKTRDDVSLARLLNQRALVAYDTSDVARARPLFEESYGLSKNLQDRPRMLVSLMNLGNISWATSSFAKAREEWEEALALARDTGQDRYEAFLREDLAILECQDGRLDEALAHFSASLALHRKVGNQEGLASALYNSSDVSRKKGDFDEALKLVVEAREIYAALEDQRGLALTSVRAGLVERERGSLEAAKAHVQEGLKIAISSGYRHPQMFALLEQAKISMREGDLDGAETLLRRSFSIGQEVGDRRHVAEVIGELAILRTLQGRAERAAALFAWVVSTYKDLGLAHMDLFNEYQSVGLTVPVVSEDPAGIPAYSSEEDFFDPVAA